MDKISLQRIAQYNVAAKDFLEKNKAETKFRYAVDKIFKKTNNTDHFAIYHKEHSKIKEKINVLRTMKASTDKDKNLMREEVTVTDSEGNTTTTKSGELKYTQENWISLNMEISGLNEEWAEQSIELLSKQIEIEPHIMSGEDVPDNLTEEQIEAFTGFVL